MLRLLVLSLINLFPYILIMYVQVVLIVMEIMRNQYRPYKI